MQHTFDHRRGRRLTNYSPGDAGTVRLTVLDNGCNGIGDILCYAWVLSSIRAAGRPISFNTHRYADILRTFGLGDLTGTLKAPRIGRHPPKDHPGGWVRHWLDAFGHSGVPIVRPTYTPDPADTEWARATWDGRGQGRRVILFPEAAHNCREWPESHGAHLAWTLHNDGCAVVVCCSRDKSAHNPFPYALWGLPFGKWCALASMADLIIGNDSGPAHVGATLGRPTLVLLGPSPRSFFAHAAEVTTLSVDTARVPCVGCNWNHNAGKGYRAACDTQCLALSTLSPFEVATKALTLMGGDASSPYLVRSIEGKPFRALREYGGDLFVCEEVFDKDYYEAKFRPEVVRVLDVGGHIGCFSSLWKSKNPHADVVAVEPHPDNHPVLALNAATFGFRTVHAAVGYRPLKLQSSVREGPHKGTSTSKLAEHGLDVRVRTLRSICEELNWPQVDLLKVDIEGGEFDLFRSGDLDLVREVIGEWHGRPEFMELVVSLTDWNLTILRDNLNVIGGMFRLTRKDPDWGLKPFSLVTSLRSTSYGPAYYEEHKAAGLDYLGHGEWQRDYAAWLLKHLASPPILDLGCACGSVVKGLVSMGGDAVGVDCSEDMIGRGRKEWPDLAPRLFVGDGANLHHWGDGHFGVVHCAQVAEHWRPSSVPAIAAEVARVLKPRGLLFLCLDTQELYDRQHRDPAKEDPTHLCIKPVSWWEGTLLEAGLTRDTALESVMGGDPKAFCRRYDWDWMVFRKGTP